MGYFIVKKGDTLTSLAKLAGTSVEELAKRNDIKNPNSIFVGQKIEFDAENSQEWIDYDRNKKVSWGDFLGYGNFTKFMNEVKQYVGKDWTKELSRKVKELYNQYVKEASFTGVNINGLSNTDYEPNTNFYRNNLDIDLTSMSLSDKNPATKIEVGINTENFKDFRDRKASDFLKKVLGDNLYNTSEIVNNNGKYQVLMKRLEGTDLYKAFISNDINPNIFTTEQNGKYTDDVFQKNYRGNVQLPSLEINSKGAKYFTLHTSGEVLYFDETGKRVPSFEDIEALPPEEYKKPDIKDGLYNGNNTEISQTFSEREGYNNKKLNIGNLYLNGKPVENINLNSNYYANGLDKILSELTLNSEGISRLDIQLKIGNELENKWDASPKDILKKFLGDNLENTTKVDGNNIVKNNMDNTDLYRTFIRLNPSLSEQDKGSEKVVQFPSMKLAPNGERYFVLIDENNKPLYFDKSGKEIVIDN